jgi:hypothetical protein
MIFTSVSKTSGGTTKIMHHKVEKEEKWKMEEAENNNSEEMDNKEMKS